MIGTFCCDISVNIFCRLSTMQERDDSLISDSSFSVRVVGWRIDVLEHSLDIVDGKYLGEGVRGVEGDSRRQSVRLMTCVLSARWRHYQWQRLQRCQSSRPESTRLQWIDSWPTLRPSQPTWAESSPVGCRHLQPPSPFIITQQRIEGWVDLGGWLHTRMA